MLKEEFREIVSKMDNIYIFGAGEVGIRLLYLIREFGQEDKVRGYIITTEPRPDLVESYKVLGLEDVPKNADIIVSVSRSYHPEVYDKLEKIGFERIISGHKFFNCVLEDKRSVSELDKKCSDDNDNTDRIENYKRKLQQELKKINLAFGDGTLYQSSTIMEIKGLRPTDYRIKEYGLMELIDKKTKVLDIGCNCGFFDIDVSRYVGSVLGIDIDDKLVKIGNEAVGALEINNVRFICGDYKEWEKTNSDSFDFIMSFSVHLWLDVLPEDYVKQLYRILEPKGHIIFESHKLPTDSRFKSFVDEFIRIGLKVKKKSTIKDDGIREREYYIFEK